MNIYETISTEIFVQTAIKGQKQIFSFGPTKNFQERSFLSGANPILKIKPMAGVK